MEATSQVLETTELLEMILLQLPLRDTLRVQRVSKTWQATITNSIKIQRALFLKPQETGSMDASTTQPVSLDTRCADVLSMPGRKTLMPAILRFEGNPKDGFTVRQLRTHTNQKASWRKMYLTQPPLSEDVIVGNYIPDPSATYGEMPQLGANPLHDIEEIKLGHFSEALEREMQRFKVAKSRGEHYRFWLRSGMNVEERSEVIKSALEDVKRASGRREFRNSLSAQHLSR